MIINIKLKENREVECSDLIIGKTLENEATILHFDLTEDMLEKDFYIEFEKPDRTKVSTPKLLVTGNRIEYAIPNSLLDIKGELKAEVVLRKDGIVWKSYTLKFNILNSINASEEIAEQYPDFISDAQKVIDEFEDKIVKADKIITDGSGNKYLSDDGTYKEVKGGDGTGDYNDLENKPLINNIELSNNKTLDDLGIQPKGNYLTNESDPTVPAHIKGITEANITNWNNKQEPLTAGENITIDGDVISATGGEEQLIWDYSDTTSESVLALFQQIYDAYKNEHKLLNCVVNYPSSANAQKIFKLTGISDYYERYSCIFSEVFNSGSGGAGVSENISIRAVLTISNNVVSSIFAEYISRYLTSRYGTGNNYGALMTNNSTSYTPTGDYHPATKKYVDETISIAITGALEGSY